MPNRRTRRQKPAPEATTYTPPATPEEYLALDNTRASRRPPRELAETAARRLTVHIPGKTAPPRLSRSKDEAGTWEFDLPAGAVLGDDAVHQSGGLARFGIEHGLRLDAAAFFELRQHLPRERLVDADVNGWCRGDLGGSLSGTFLAAGYGEQDANREAANEVSFSHSYLRTRFAANLQGTPSE